MNLILSVLASLCLLLCQPAAVSSAARPEQQPGIHPADNPFFTQPEIVELSLSLPLAKILSDRGASPRLHPATISYQDAGPTTKTVAVQVQVRGNRRKDPTVCGFPPLLVKFPPEATHGTLFGPVTELKLTTHCLSDTYTLREYLVYKLFNVLTDVSYRTRLCRITYRDNGGKDNATVRYAFFLESTEVLALRSQTKVVPKKLFFGMENVDPAAMATLAVFQYMVGNTDWSVPFRHNIRLLTQNPLSAPVPVPFDFDYSGLVMAPYAAPPEQLGITSVRERAFQGYGFAPETYAAVRNLFNARREALYQVYLACPYLSQKERNFATNYLNDFFETLNDTKAFERSIVRMGHRNEKKHLDIRGFD